MGVGYWQRFRGNDETPVLRGLASFGVSAHIIVSPNAQDYGRLVDADLQAGRPVILCTDDEEHWIVLSGKSGDQYLWIDSNEQSLFGSCSHEELFEWTQYTTEAGDRSHWALIPRPAKPHCSMVPRMEEASRVIMDDEHLRKHWSSYLQLVQSLHSLAFTSGRRLWTYLDGKPPSLSREIESAMPNLAKAEAELERISWVSYCHDTKMPSLEISIPTLAGFLASR
jgi:hypothetical protein